MFTSRRLDENHIYSLYRLILEQEDREMSDAMSPEVFEKYEDKLVKAKYALYRDYPFFGVLLTKLRTVPTDSIPTMAVDNYDNIYMNPGFVVNELTDAEVVGVLAHEVMHIMTETFFRQRGRDAELWNIATDYLMNRDLIEMGMSLPKLGLIPQQRGKSYFVVEPVPGSTPITIDITDENAEGLYDALIAEAKKKGKKNKGGQQGQGGQGQGQDGQGEGSIKDIIDRLTKKQQKLDKHLTDEEAKKIKPKDVPSESETYKPDIPGENQPGQTEAERRGKRISKIQSAAEEAEKTRGEGAGVPRSFNKNIFKPKTNWKALLKRFVTAASKTNYDWSKPNKRALASGYYAPRTREEQENLDIVVAVDTSGSISDNILNVFINELLNIVKSFKQVKINLLLWNTDVYEDVEISNKKGIANVQKELTGLKYVEGGTTISSIKHYLDKKNRQNKNKKINGLVVFTDGEVESNPVFPDTSKKLFMITEGGTDAILKKYGPTFFVDVPHS